MKCQYEGPGGRQCSKQAIYKCPYCENKLCEEHAKEMSGGPPYHCSNNDCKPQLVKIKNLK